MSAILRYRCTDRCQAGHRHVREWTTATADEVPKDSGAEYECMAVSDSTAAPSPREPKPTNCTDLASWLLEQIAEDERQVDELRESDYGDRTLIEEPWFEEGIYTPDISDFGGLWISPARVLAECEAKRAIIELLSDNPVRPRHYDFVQADDQERVADRLFYDMARLLALPYADRPGFREEWQPQ